MTSFGPYPIVDDNAAPNTAISGPSNATGFVARLISTFTGIACSAFARIRPPAVPQMFLMVNSHGHHCPVTERILKRHAEAPISGLVVANVVHPLKPLTLVIVAPHPRSRITFLTSADDVIFALFGSKGLDKSPEEIETEKREVLMGLADPGPALSDTTDEAPDGDSFAPLDVPMLVPDREAPTADQWNEMLRLARGNLSDPPDVADSVLKVTRTDPLSVALVRALVKGLGDKDVLKSIRLESDVNGLKPRLCPAVASESGPGHADALPALGLTANIEVSYDETLRVPIDLRKIPGVPSLESGAPFKREAFIVVREKEMPKPKP